jgi:crossover junction endodeoxyribonuclease RusA
LADLETPYPLEFIIAATPISLQGSAASKRRWKAAVEAAARERIREKVELHFLDRRSISLTVYYFTSALMQGDIDNIVKPIMDALVGVAYMDDKDVERVVIQKFEPGVEWFFADPREELAAALDTDPPVVYIRIDDDLSWRFL